MLFRSRNQHITLEQLAELDNSDSGLPALLMPKNRRELSVAIKENPDARLFAGSTDLALEVTQQLKSLPKLISLTEVDELQDIEETEDGLKIGAAVPFSKMETVLLKHFPALHELIERFASTPIRNQATLGGNVANASPIGDMPPALLALNAVIHVDNGSTKREINISEFFTGYRQMLLKQGEWIAGIYIPFLSAAAQVRAYKVSKRQEDDISAVCAVFNLTLDDNNIVQRLNTGFGGVAATPASDDALSNILVGKDWTLAETFEAGKNVFSEIGRASCRERV